jgi:hypothetical protein
VCQIDIAQLMTTLHPCSGVGTWHREDGSRVQVNALVCFGGLDPSSRKPVSGAVHKWRCAGVVRLGTDPTCGSIAGPESRRRDAGISTAFRTPSYCTAIQAFNCLCSARLTGAPGHILQVPAAHSRIPTVLLYSEYSERTSVTVLFATDKLKTISAISQGHHQVSF